MSFLLSKCIVNYVVEMFTFCLQIILLQHYVMKI